MNKMEVIFSHTVYLGLINIFNTSNMVASNVKFYSFKKLIIYDWVTKPLKQEKGWDR